VKITDMITSSDARTITFKFEDGGQEVLETGIEAVRFYDVLTHVMCAMGGTILTLSKRLEALEAMK